jgi:hypothetical protein
MGILDSWRKARIIAMGLWTGACAYTPSDHPLLLPQAPLARLFSHERNSNETAL